MREKHRHESISSDEASTEGIQSQQKKKKKKTMMEATRHFNSVASVDTTPLSEISFINKIIKQISDFIKKSFLLIKTDHQCIRDRSLIVSHRTRTFEN